MTVKGLHHSAYRCRDAGETRVFYEDFLGLPLAETLLIHTTKTGRETDAVHIFFRMGDGSYLAFFEAPDLPFDFKPQHDYDLHIALEVDWPTLEAMLAKGKATGVETRGIVGHRIFDSLYFRDPNGYVIELTCKRQGHDAAMDPAQNRARERLDSWQADRGRVAPSDVR